MIEHVVGGLYENEIGTFSYLVVAVRSVSVLVLLLANDNGSNIGSLLWWPISLCRSDVRLT